MASTGQRFSSNFTGPRGIAPPRQVADEIKYAHDTGQVLKPSDVQVRYTLLISENAFRKIPNVYIDIKLGINYNGDQCTRKLNSELDSLQMKEPCQVLSELMKLYTLAQCRLATRIDVRYDKNVRVAIQCYELEPAMRNFSTLNYRGLKYENIDVFRLWMLSP